MPQCGIAYRWRAKTCYKQKQARIGPVSAGKPIYGVVATTGVPPDPSAGDDAAADAGHQAAAALQPRPGRLCRRRARAQSAARARRATTTRRRRPPPSRAGAPRRRTARTAGRRRHRRLDRRGPGDQPQLHGRGARHRARKRLPRRWRRENAPPPETPPPAYSEWSGAGTRGGEDGDYNLEAFVSAEITLADHLAEQMALAISDPAAPHDRAIPDRYGRRGRLSHRRSRHRRRQARRAARRRRGRARHPADARSARRVRAQSHRMSRDPAQGTRPLRSGDAGAGRASRSAGQARSRRACAGCAASTTKISPT